MAKPKPERLIENRCVLRARSFGWLARKMNGMGYRDWPDRLFIEAPKKRRGKLWSGGVVFWVEFKRVGEEPTPKQAALHRQLRERGQAVYVIDNLDDFLAIPELR